MTNANVQIQTAEWPEFGALDTCIKEISKASTISVKDPGSALTHFIGFVAAVTATPFLLGRMITHGADGILLFGTVLFCLGMILLYGASTTYHTIRAEGKRAKALKKFDHLMIFLLIAGTYSPICLSILRDSCGYLLFGIVWGIALVGMVFKLCWVTCPKWVSSVIYIGMGWTCLIAFPQLLDRLAVPAFWLLLIGGLMYTVGGVIYALKLKAFNRIHPYFGSHEVFHLFVLAGSVCHFLVVYLWLV